jgi:kynureninase
MRRPSRRQPLIALSGATLTANGEENYAAMLALAAGKWSEHEFAAWLRARLRRPRRGAVHEARARHASKRRAARAR